MMELPLKGRKRLPAWILGSILSTFVHDADARTLVHLNKAVWGCFNPSVAAIINDETNPGRFDRAWVARTSDMGECVTITPGSVWEPLTASRNGFTYVAYRGTAAKPASFWVPTGSLVALPPELTPALPVAVKPEPLPPPPAVQDATPAQPTPPPPEAEASQQLEAQPAEQPAAVTPPVIAPTSKNPPPSTGGDAGLGSILLIIGLVFLFLVRSSRKRRKAAASRKAPPRVTQGRTAAGTPRPPTPLPVHAPAKPWARAARADPSGSPRTAVGETGRPLWYPPGTPAQVSSYRIRDGMVYVGNVSSRSGYEDACVVDPALPVARRGAAEKLGYWPSYGGLSGECRRVYLDWLASGKRAPDAEIGYVFLYFYGLERRLFLEAPSPEETGSLVLEVERLRSLYADNHSFEGYSRRLLETVAVLRDASSAWKPEPDSPPGFMPLALKVAAGREVVAGRPLGFELAAAILLALKDFRPGSRLVLGSGREAFLTVLKARFETAFPTGLVVRNRKDSCLQLIYRGAMAGLSVDLTARAGLTGLPDPATLTWTKLLALGEAVAEEVAPHLKSLAYHPDQANSLVAMALCPPELRDTVAVEARRWAERLPPVAAVPFGEVARHAIGATSLKWTLRQRRQVGEALAGVGLAMEPDPEDVGRPMEDATTVYVFHATGGRSRAMKVASVAAMFVTYLARGATRPVEAVDEAWLARLPSRLALTADETVRLRARLAWLRDADLNMTRVKRALGDATAEENELCIWSATVAAGASGTVDKIKVAILEKLCDALGVARSALYAGIHMDLGAASASAAEPVAVSEAEPEVIHPIAGPPAQQVGVVSASSTGPMDVAEAVPTVPRAVPGSPELGVPEHDRLARIRAETQQVSEMLAVIFKEEEPDAGVFEKDEKSAFPGLDAPHAGLVTKLITRPQWPRTEFEEMACSVDLMPDGAMEAVNEWAFDFYGDALLEDGDPVVVNSVLLEEKREVAAAAE